MGSEMCIRDRLSTWSSISRCCPVTQTLAVKRSSAARLNAKGAILIASGRVPNTHRVLKVIATPLLKVKINARLRHNPRIRVPSVVIRFCTRYARAQGRGTAQSDSGNMTSDSCACVIFWNSTRRQLQARELRFVRIPSHLPGSSENSRASSFRPVWQCVCTPAMITQQVVRIL